MLLFLFVGVSVSAMALDETYTYTTGDGSGTTSTWTYQSSNFTFVQLKNAGSNIVSNTAEMRIYASHTMEVYPTVSGKIISSIEVTCSNSTYATAMGSSTIIAGTSSSSTASVSGISNVNGSVATFNLSGVSGCQYIKFTLANQARTTIWKITYTSAGNTAPILTTPTSSVITTTSATLGATISGNGGVSISESGIVYGTTASPTGNATSTSPTVSSNTAFTVPVSSLSPQTLYYYRGYAVNTQGTGYSADGTFRTLSNPPTGQASSLNASPTSGTALNITWSAATFPVSGATTKGYVLLRATSPNTPSLGNSNGAAPTAGTNTTIVSSSITEAAISQANSGLSANTTYNYLLVPYSWDGTNAATYNYLTTSAPTCSITTPSAVSDVVAVASSESATISSIVNDAAPLTSTSGVQAWQITVRDGGSTLSDADNLPTIVTGLTLTQNTGNAVDNWLDAIKTIALFDGTTWIANATSITATTIVFSGLNINVTDNTSKTLSLRLSLNAPLNNAGTGNLDGDDFVFNLTSANFSTLTDGTSSTKSSFTTASSTNGQNAIDVTATKLVFIQQPTTGIAANIAMTPNPTVKAVDANNNTDLHYLTAVSVTSTGSLNGTPVSGTWASNVATFASLIHSVSGTGLQLTAASGTLTSAVSNTFDVAEGCTSYPTITTTVTPNTIATTTASSGGQTLGVEAGCSITNKGVCWGTSTLPTVAGSKTDDGTGTANFTSSITGLTAGTLYYVRAYATTSFGTAYGDEKTFRTLSLEPSAQQPATFTSTIISSSQIDLAFSAASTITNGGGYIILQKSGSAATGLPTDGTGYIVGATIGDATVAAVVNSSTTTTSITGLNGNTTYYFSIIPLNWDGSNTTTYNYKTSATVLTTNKTTLKIEPTNQATNFAVGTVTTANIPLTWTAAVAGSQAPDGYLIKLSTSSVVDPVDGTSPSDALNVSGGSGNKNTTGTSYNSFTNWTAGTMYNFKIYSYSNSSTNINFNTTAVPTLSHATLPAAVTGTSVTASGTTTANVTWTLPGSYVAGNHSTLVFIKSGSSITTGTPTNAPSTYTANTTFASGTAYQGDAAAYCVYNGDGTSVSVTGLNANTTYYALIYTVVDASNSNATNSYSATSTPSGATLKIEPTNQATAFSVGGVTTSAIPLTWTAAVAGSQAPDGYLIKLNTSTVVDPVDGTDPSNVTSITSGAANKTATGTSATSFTNMTAGTMYNYKIYSYTNSGTNINFNTTSAPSLNHATLPAVVTATSFTATGTTTANIAWTLPASYSAGNHSTVVFVKATNAITAGTPTNAPSTYTANTSFGSGIVYQNDAQANCVYNGDGTSVSITGLSVGTTYHVLIYTVVDASNSNSTNSYSAAATLSGATFTNSVTLPYSQDFEGATNEWSFGTGTNIWTIGSATNNGGTKALYISNDGGTTNVYNVDFSQSGTDAIVRVDLTGQAAATLSFDWKSNGELYSGSWVDYGEVYINTGSSDVLISSAKEFVNSTTFATKSISLTPYVGRVVSLKFRWVNDGSVGNQPPFAIDNLNITAGDYSTLTTVATSSITSNGVTTGGNITNDGGSTISARGICYSTSPTPTISGDKTSDGTGTGSFVSTLSGLIDNTTYYVRAYATNSTGTAYGNEISFTTSSLAAPTASYGTNISSTGFTANWGAVTNANYRLDVSTSSTFGNAINSTDLLISEYVEGSSSNRYIEIYNGTGASVDLSNYKLRLFANGVSTPTSDVALTGTLDNNSTIVYNGSGATAYNGTTSTNNACTYNGDDAIALYKVSTSSYVDIFGKIGEDPGSEWTSSTFTTLDKTLVRKASVTGGTTNNPASGFPTLGTEWEQFNIDDVTHLGSHTFNAINPIFLSGYQDKNEYSANSQEITGLTPNTTYYYRVRAIGGNSTSANSNTITVLTLPLAPTATEETNASASGFTATWTLPAGGATSYSLDVSENIDFSSYVSGYENLTVTGTSQVVSGLSPNTTYYYRVKANNASGTSTSATITATTNNAIPVSSSVNVSTLPVCNTCDLIVADGATLTVNENRTFATASVSPTGQLTNSGNTLTLGSLTLNSDATGTATFVDNGTTTVSSATIEQYLPSSRNWYMSAPLSNAKVLAGYTYYQYNEPNGSLGTNWTSPAVDDVLVAGRGYIVKPTAEDTYSFTTNSNTLNTGNIEITISRTDGILKAGFNLIGNPYPSYLNIDNLVNSNVEASYWLRTRNAAGNGWTFDTYNMPSTLSTGNSGKSVTKYIAPMQSFWLRVKSSSTPATLTFTNAMRAHKDEINNRFRAPEVDAQKVLRLEVSNNLNADQTLIYFNSKASNNLDSYDSPKMLNDIASVPEIYTQIGSEKIAINGMKDLVLDQEFPLTFNTGESNTFNLKVTEFSNFDSQIHVILKDRLNVENSEFDLTTDGNYSFVSDAISTANRFSIIFRNSSITTGLDKKQSADNGTIVYCNDQNNLVIICNNSVIKNAIAIVYNAVGQKLKTQQITSTTTIIEERLSSGVYFVKISTNGKSITQKVVIK